MIFWNQIKVHDIKSKTTTEIVSSSNNLKRQEFFSKVHRGFSKNIENAGPSSEWRVQSVL